jgi:hypothetical protein
MRIEEFFTDTICLTGIEMIVSVIIALVIVETLGFLWGRFID